MAGSSWANQLVNRVIIVGPNGQLIMYSGTTPAVNQLVASIVQTDMQDSVGNNLLGGGFSAYVELAPGSFAASTYEGNGFVVQHATAQNSGYTAKAAIVWSDQFTSPGFRLINETSGAALLLLDSVQETMAVGPVVAQDPANAGVPESWHSLGTLAGYTVTAARYRLTALNSVEFDIDVSSAGANAANTTFANTLPTAYRRADSRTYPLTSNLAIASMTSLPRLGITAAGAVSVSQTASVTTAVIGQAFMPLN